MARGSELKSRDFFAELYVAGLLGDAGWSIYFPKRDVGFDFIATKETPRAIIIRPVQVKGKYPGGNKGDRSSYGYIGPLSQMHPEMALAIPYFPTDQHGVAPTCTAFMPQWAIRRQASKGWACRPAQFTGGVPKPRRKFQRYFDYGGMALMEDTGWSVPPAAGNDDEE